MSTHYSPSRRRFLTAAGTALAGVPFLAACTARENKRVAVVGAGLAGLAATYELKRAGIEVQLFEQSDRAGGRCWTIRDVFADGAFVDAGAMGAGGGYTNWLAYCEQFRVPLDKSGSNNGGPGALLLLDGQMYSAAALRSDPGRWPIDLHDDEKSRAPFGLLSAELMPIAREIGAVENVLLPQYAEYDDLSLLDFLQQRGTSPAAIGLIERSLNYNSLESVSTLSALRDMTRRVVGSGAGVSIEGGNSRLPEAMAGALRDEINFRRELTEISIREDGATLQMSGPQGRESFDATHVVLALPFTALKNIAIDPPLPAERREIIENLPYTQIAKTFVQTRSRFWQDSADFSLLYTDTDFERTFNLSNQMPGERGLLMNWINGVGLDSFNSLSARQHQRKVTGWMKGLWPGNDEQFEQALTINWNQSYAGGAYAHYAPGQLQRFATEIPKPLGPLHFAGEHTELVAPGLEGAVTSGIRVATEILHA